MVSKFDMVLLLMASKWLLVHPVLDYWSEGFDEGKHFTELYFLRFAFFHQGKQPFYLSV
jgi:hypothetical protein